MKAIFLLMGLFTLFTTAAAFVVSGHRKQSKIRRKLRDAEELEKRCCLFEKQMQAREAMGETWCCYDKPVIKPGKPTLRLIK